MPTTKYSYQGLTRTGAKVKGKLDAESEAAVTQRLANEGVIATSISGGGTGLNREINIPGLESKKPKLKDLVVFTRQLATMIESGLSLVRALSILQDNTSHAGLRKAVGELEESVQAGISLSAAMEKRDDVFPTLMIHLVRAGEVGGFLDESLKRVATILEADQKLQQKVKSAMTYPMVVLGLTVVIVTIMLIFIVPVFESMFTDLGGDLPLPTRALVVASENIWWALPLLLGIIALIVFLFKRKLKNDHEFRIRFDAAKLKAPLFGPLVLKIAMSRFSRTLGTLMGSGVPLLQALESVAQTTGNARVGQVLLEARTSVSEGRALSAPMADSPDIFPGMVTQMLQVGEDTGQIEAMLAKVAQFYDQEVEAMTDALTSIMEPLLIVILGVVVGGMVIALYLPMFSIYDQIN